MNAPSWKAGWMLLLLALPGISCHSEPAPAGPVRPPSQAGAFYPGSADTLRSTVDALLAAAQPPAVKGPVRALVLPHAGYPYSGPVAASGIKTLAGQDIQTVVVVASSHHSAYRGAAIWPRGAFRTPLGDIPIDEDMTAKLLAKGSPFIDAEAPHLPDHVIEVELPLLQRALGSFRLVPVLLGTPETSVSLAVGQALAEVAKPGTLVIASTDLSHYPAYRDACTYDARTVMAVLTGDPLRLDRELRSMEKLGVPQVATFMCSEGAVKAVMTYAQRIGADQTTLLQYQNSGDTAGDRNRVVGYAAIAFSGGEIAGQPQTPAPAAESDNEFTPEQRAELLHLARQTVESLVRDGKPPETPPVPPDLERQRGAFVTLKKHGQLRGCIGRFDADQSVWQTVADMAVAAAIHDSRFRPVSESELPDLEYEISVLSPLRKVAGPQDIRLGKHGVQVVRGWHRGVFLPQVATETGWDLDTFLDVLCTQKAGLPAKAWKDPETDLYVFTAEVFADHK